MAHRWCSTHSHSNHSWSVNGLPLCVGLIPSFRFSNAGLVPLSTNSSMYLVSVGIGPWVHTQTGQCRHLTHGLLPAWLSGLRGGVLGRADRICTPAGDRDPAVAVFHVANRAAGPARSRRSQAKGIGSSPRPATL